MTNVSQCGTLVVACRVNGVYPHPLFAFWFFDIGQPCEVDGISVELSTVFIDFCWRTIGVFFRATWISP